MISLKKYLWIYGIYSYSNNKAYAMDAYPATIIEITIARKLRMIMIHQGIYFPYWKQQWQPDGDVRHHEGEKVKIFRQVLPFDLNNMYGSMQREENNLGWSFIMCTLTILTCTTQRGLVGSPVLLTYIVDVTKTASDLNCNRWQIVAPSQG